MRKLVEIERKDLLFNGIYKIINIKTGKFYVGSCAAKDFIYTRLLHHKYDLKANRHINKYLQNSFNKYGIEVFYVEILEICKPEECIEKEQFWIDILRPEYNFQKFARNSKGRSVSQETRNKISRANKEWYNKNPEFKDKLRELAKQPRNISNERRLKSKELRRKMNYEDNPAKFKRKKVRNITSGEIYNSIRECYSKLNISTTTFYRILKGEPLVEERLKNIKLEIYE